jgi:hypothetical protein
MEFGVQFFPSVGPARKSPAEYWDEALALTRLAERLGMSAPSSIISIPTAATALTR